MKIMLSRIWVCIFILQFEGTTCQQDADSGVYFLPSSIKVSGVKFQALLYLDENYDRSNEVTFLCHARVVLDASESISCKAQESSSSDARSGDWDVPPDVIIPLDRKVATFWVRRLAYPSANGYENVAVSCCEMLNFTSSSSQQRGSSMLAEVFLTPLVDVDENNAKKVGDDLQELEIKNPGYVAFGQCPCNLQGGVCDPACCCDNLCSATDRLLFQCTPGVFGGKPILVNANFCSSKNKIQPDWFPALCVHTNRSQLLGSFNFPKSILRNRFSMEQERQSGEKFSYQEIEHRFPEETPDTLTYRKDSGIRTIFEGVIPGPSYRLAQPVNTGFSCISTSALQYLQDSDNVCDVPISNELCQATPQFNARNYLKNSQSKQTYDFVLQQKQAKNISETYVEYLCFDESETVVTDCNFVDELPPAPSVNEETQTCDNTVRDVVYNFTWQADQILQVNVSITLFSAKFFPQTVSGSEEPSVSAVHQTFRTTFIAYENFNSTEGRYKRSGKLGYANGLPIISGRAIYNNSDDFVISRQPEDSLLFPQAGVLGSCNETEEIEYLLNKVSACIIKVAKEDFLDCSAIRNQVYDFTDNLFNATHISRGGDPNNTNIDDWISIARRERDNSTVEKPIIGQCENVPHQIRLQIFYAHVGLALGEILSEVVGTSIDYELSSLTAESPMLFLTVSVDWINIPPRKAPRRSRRADETEEYVCKYDTCWRDILRPWLQQTRTETHQERLAYLLSLIALTIFIITITKSWY